MSTRVITRCQSQPPSILSTTEFQTERTYVRALSEPPLTLWPITHTVSSSTLCVRVTRDSWLTANHQCNGLKPCNTCTKRNFVCEYLPQNGHTPTHNAGQGLAGNPTLSPSRRRISTPETVGSVEEPTTKRLKSSGDGLGSQLDQQYPPRRSSDANEPSRLLGLPTPIPPPSVPAQPHRELDIDNHSRQSTTSGNDEVAEVYTETRMLQDPTGRLRKSFVYITLVFTH